MRKTANPTLPAPVVYIYLSTPSDLHVDSSAPIDPLAIVISDVNPSVLSGERLSRLTHALEDAASSSAPLEISVVDDKIVAPGLADLSDRLAAVLKAHGVPCRTVEPSAPAALSAKTFTVDKCVLVADGIMPLPMRATKTAARHAEQRAVERTKLDHALPAIGFRRAKMSAISNAYKTGQDAAFSTYQVKHAWFGKYYHGTDAAVEPSIMQEGLRGSMGGRGGWNAAAGSALSRARDAGRVYVTPSKVIAKAYGTIPHFREHLKGYLGLHPDVEKIPFSTMLRRTAQDFMGYQPLQVQGVPLKTGLGLIIPGLEKYHVGDVPVSSITKASPSRVGNLIRRLIP